MSYGSAMSTPFMRAVMAQMQAATPYVSGRALYDEHSITGLNRIPVIKLAGYVLAGAKLLTPPRYNVSLEEIHATLEIDGSLLMVNGEMQTGVIQADWDSCVQCIPACAIEGGAQDIYREYEITPDGVTVTDWLHYGEAAQAIIAGPTALPRADVVWYYNAAEPVGILYHAQGTYRRIEEISQTVRRFQKGPATKVGVTGYVRDEDKVRAEMMNDDPMYIISGVNTQITMGGNTAAIDQLLNEQSKLLPMYYQQTHIVDTESPVQRPSGADRTLVMGPMLRYVDTVRAQITNVLEQLGATWTTERIHTTDILDRQNEFNLLVQLLQMGKPALETGGEGVITWDEFQTSAKELIG
jgi:hypothetical protein